MAVQLRTPGSVHEPPRGLAQVPGMNRQEGPRVLSQSLKRCLGELPYLKKLDG